MKSQVFTTLLFYDNIISLRCILNTPQSHSTSTRNQHQPFNEIAYNMCHQTAEGPAQYK